MKRHVVSAVCAFVLTLTAAAPASAGGPLPPELEFEWARVRAKNNAAWSGHWPHFPPQPPVTVGAVDRNYRIATKPVTNRQWLEFVVAYDAQFGYPSGQSLQFLGDYIVRVGSEYLMLGSGVTNLPVRIGWRYAAIYTNWLHNGKQATPEAFLSGAYDVSTFGANPDGTLTDQRTRSPGAKYWIPTMDEWVKAMYYDPNRHGEGQGGYWLHPGMQDTPLFTETPANGGQTNAGILDLYPHDSPPLHALNVGSYPHVQSPWGVLDASGGEEEWLETMHASNQGRLGRLSNYTFYNDNSWDHIAHIWSGGMTSSRMGFRVAAIIPAPGSVALAPLTLFLIASRRTRRA